MGKILKFKLGDFIGDNGISYVGDFEIKNNKRHCVFKCHCGKEYVCSLSKVKSSKNKSCGCKRFGQSKIHGMAKSPEYKSWTHMKGRCNNPTDNKYKNYGARGIMICDEWNNSFESFLRDMGEKPSPKHSIDRIDNDGNYCKENCRWATNEEQCVNKTTSFFIEWEGIRLTMSQWEERLSLKKGSMRSRKGKGWSIERIMSTPLISRKI